MFESARARRPLALLAVIATVACGGGKDPADSRVTAGGVTSTGTPGAAPVATDEDCTDGIDNDLDGLLDCEDDDCFGDVGCAETACNDGADNDADGRIDCVDEDCWGNGCAVTEASLGGAGYGLRDMRYGLVSTFGDPQCAATSMLFSGEIGLKLPAGTLHVIPTTGTTWTTCAWSASSSWIAPGATGFGDGVNAYPVVRPGFAVSSGCPIQTSGFLPQYWAAERTSSAWAFTTRPTGNGPLWATMAFNVPSQVISTNYASTNFTPGSPCSTRSSHHSTYSQMYSMGFGATYRLTGL